MLTTSGRSKVGVADLLLRHERTEAGMGDAPDGA